MDYFRYMIDIIWGADQIGSNTFDFITALMCLIFSIVNLVFYFKQVPPVAIYSFMLIFGVCTAVVHVINQSIDISRASDVFIGRYLGYLIFRKVLEMMLVAGEVFSFLKVCRFERHHCVARHEIVYHT